MLNKLKEVSQEEMIDFINNYPRELLRNVSGISEPPMVGFYDPSLEGISHTLVAKYFMYSDDSTDRYYDPNPKFYISLEERRCKEFVK